FGPRTQPDNGSSQPTHLTALSATAAQDIGDIVHGTGYRATAKTSVQVPTRKRTPHFRSRIAGWLFRYFPLQPAVPFSLRRYAKTHPHTCPYGQHVGPYSLSLNSD